MLSRLLLAAESFSKAMTSRWLMIFLSARWACSISLRAVSSSLSATERWSFASLMRR
jgi:hypothetical protein